MRLKKYFLRSLSLVVARARDQAPARVSPRSFLMHVSESLTEPTECIARDHACDNLEISRLVKGHQNTKIN